MTHSPEASRLCRYAKVRGWPPSFGPRELSSGEQRQFDVFCALRAEADEQTSDRRLADISAFVGGPGVLATWANGQLFCSTDDPWHTYMEARLIAGPSAAVRILVTS